MELPDKIKEAVSALARLPGVGEKTAFRMVLSVSKWNKAEITIFSNAIKELSELKFCQLCGFFSEEDACEICLNENRHHIKSICIVESISDLMAIERSGQYKGLYHILSGVLNPLLGIGPSQLKLDVLVERVKLNQIKDIILAINPSVEGDATCSYIKSILPSELNVQRIGFGVPIGGTLEFLDPMTITKALENRRNI